MGFDLKKPKKCLFKTPKKLILCSNEINPLGARKLVYFRQADKFSCDKKLIFTPLINLDVFKKNNRLENACTKIFCCSGRVNKVNNPDFIAGIPHKNSF